MPPQITPARLGQAIRHSYTKLRHFRQARLQFLVQYGGRFYSERNLSVTDNKAYPLNLIWSGVTTLVPNLVFADPRCAISSPWMMYQPYADQLALEVNQLARTTAYRKTLRMVITDSIFLFGLTKRGLGVSDQTLDLEGVKHIIGQPYIDRVDPDDYVVDPLARDREEVLFEGNRFRIPRQEALDGGIYDPDDVNSLTSRYDQPRAEEANQISGTYGFSAAQANELVDYVDLVEIWLPRDKRIVTVPYDPTGSVRKFLRDVDYFGPPEGPYNMLGYAWMPDNILPVAPCMVWYDLHQMANRIARKTARQAERQKAVLAYEGTAWEDAKSIVDADDGEAIQVNRLEAIKEIKYGGANPEAFQYLGWAESEFSKLSYNSDLLSGERAPSKTATQDQMLQGNANVRIADMGEMVYEHAAEDLRVMMAFIHTDPLRETPLVQQVQGQDRQIMMSPERRVGTWADYSLKVIPFSMARKDPQQQAMRILDFFSRAVPALAQASQMLGPALNLEQSLILIGRYEGIEELEQILNLPTLHQQMQQLQQLVQSGVAVTPQVVQQVMNPMTLLGGGNGGEGAAGGPVGGVRPQQPNPSATGPDETPALLNSGAQMVSGQLQRHMGDFAGRSMAGALMGGPGT
jgi:hypothetical protein